MRLEYDWYFWGTILIAISIIWAVFCIVRDKGKHKTLVFFTSLLCVVAVVCFGGDAILSLFGMGWRCKPFNTMLGLCSLLLIPVLLCGIWQLIGLYENTNPTLILCGVISMLLALIVIPFSSWMYLEGISFSDWLTGHDGQTIVCASNGHGSFGERRYYIHINDLVHGAELDYDWREAQSWDWITPRSFH